MATITVERTQSVTIEIPDEEYFGKTKAELHKRLFQEVEKFDSGTWSDQFDLEFFDENGNEVF